MRLFTCPNVPSELKLTKKACAQYYRKANQFSRYRQSESDSSIHRYCVNCQIGKTNSEYYNKPFKKTKPKKVCRLYEIDPDRCTNTNKNGYFCMEKRHSEFDWNNKIFCSQRCALLYHGHRAKGFIK